MSIRHSCAASVLYLTVCSLIPAAAQHNGPLPVRENAPTVDYRDVEQLMGQKAFVQGKIVATKNIGKICFLNFDDYRKRKFTGVIHFNSFYPFEGKPEETYLNKHVRIFGQIKRYGGRPEIGIYRPEQIEIIADDAPMPQRLSPPKEKTKQTLPDVITVATLNVMNLFDAWDNPYHEDEGTPVKPRQQLDALAKLIRELDADVLALQEVENRGYLTRFVNKLLPDAGYDHIAHLEGNDLRGIDCSVLSRLPLGPVTSYRHVEFKDTEGEMMRFRRDLLRVRILPESDEAGFDIFVVHLKSKGSGPSSDVIRVGEARAIREQADRMLASNPNARFIICGDFNDLWESEALQTIRGSGESALKTFFESIPESKRITYNRAPHRSMIDFIFASPAMAEHYIQNSYAIGDGSIEETGTDHNPVSARFRLK